MPDQELRMRAKFEGGDQAAGELKKVDEAQKQVGKTTGTQTKAVKQATAAQQKLNATEGDYSMLLGRVHPLLGVMVEASVKAAKIAGDLATRQITLGGALTKVTGAVRANAKALLLVGAGGAVIAGIAAIVAVYNRLKESIKRSTEAVRADSAAMAENNALIREQEKAIRDLANARQAMARMTVAESKEVRSAAQRDVERFHGAVGYDTAANIRAMFQGAGLSEDQLTRLIQAAASGASIDVDQRAPGWSRRGYAESTLEQATTQKAIQATRKAASNLLRNVAQEAFRELTSADGPVGNLARFVKPYLRPGQDAEEIARTLQKIGIDVEGAARRGAGGITGPFAAYHVGRLMREAGGGNVPVETLEPTGYFHEGTGLARRYVSVPAEELAQMTLAVRRLNQLLEGGQLTGASPPGGATIQAATVHVHPTSAMVQQAAICNGQNWADRMGIEGN